MVTMTRGTLAVAKERAFPLVGVEQPLHGEGTDREAVAVPGTDLGDGPAHEPCLARLAGRPNGEEVAALVGVAEQPLHALLDELGTRDAEVLLGIDRPVGVEPSHRGQSTTFVPMGAL
jgi:hypothetical protein